MKILKMRESKNTYNISKDSQHRHSDACICLMYETLAKPTMFLIDHHV